MRAKLPIRIFVLIDALGWPAVSKLDFLGDVLPHRRPLRTVLGYSSGAIPTILTGRVPAEHGHWNLFYYDPAGSPFRWLQHMGLPHRVLDNRVGRRLLKEVGRRVLGLGPLFEVCVPPHLLPLLNWVEKRNIYAAGGISGGGTIFDEVQRSGIPHRVYSYHHFRDAEILRRAEADLEAGGFFFLYLSELDGFLHGHCELDAALQARLDVYADGLRRVFARATELDPGATLTVLSDHGMTPVQHRCDLVARVEALGLRMPAEYLAVYDSTMARFWPFTAPARHALTDLLGTIRGGRLLSDDELRDLGIFFDDRRYGELIFLLEPGWLIDGSDFSGRGWTPAGMHGYHPDDPSSDAVILSSHGFPDALRTISDVYPLMVESAGGVAPDAPAAVDRECPLCREDSSKSVASIPGRVRCQCGMVYRPTRPPNREQERYWDLQEYADAERLQRSYGPRRAGVHRALVEDLSRLVRVGSWLDIGCGPGHLLAEARAAGWHTVGIDPSRRAAALASTCGGTVICGSFPEGLPSGSFDVVSCLYTLEYVQDPVAFLRACAERLGPGGALALQLKNFAFWRWAERFYRGGGGVWCPADVRSYSPKTITAALVEAGFGRVSVMPAQLPLRSGLNAAFRLLDRLGMPVLAPSMTVIARSAERGVGALSTRGAR